MPAKPSASQGPAPDENNAKMAMKAIQTEVKRLLDAWDPLCLRGLPGFQQEYNQYVGPLAVLVRKRVPPIDIAAHLHRLVTEEWKLPACRERCLDIGEKMHRSGAFLDPPKAPLKK